MAAMLSMGPGVLLFGRIVRAGGSSKLSVFAGTALIAFLFAATAVVVGRLTLRLEQKN